MSEFNQGGIRTLMEAIYDYIYGSEEKDKEETEASDADSN